MKALEVSLSKHFRDVKNVFSQIKLETFSKEKPCNRYSPERYRTQPKIYRSISTLLSNCSKFPLINLHHQQKLDRYCSGSNYNASFLCWIWINLAVTNFYTSLVVYSKVGQLSTYLIALKENTYAFSLQVISSD